MQIHDEVILEGPEESSDAALRLVLADMQDPFDQPLRVDLVVDAKVCAIAGELSLCFSHCLGVCIQIATNWYDAK